MRKGILALLLVTVAATGCSQLLGSLRRDLDDDPGYSNDGPTVGGQFSERGLLNDDNNHYVGHAERGPASVDQDPRGGDSWISEEREAQNRRDDMRGEDQGGVTLSNTPDLPPPVKRQYKNGSRATAADFVDDSQNEGSLWGSDGQTNYYFTKNKIRGPGDIVTVTLEPAMIKDITQEVKRTLTPKERDYEMAAAQERIRNKALGLPDPDAPKGTDQVATSAAAPARAPAADGTTPAAAPAEIKIPDATVADVDVGRSLDVKAGDPIMAEVLERYPNGNYKIRGTKRIAYKGGPPRYLTLTAIARGADISEEDVITSGKLYEYRLESVR